MVLVMCIMIVLIFIMIIGVVFAAYEIENCFTCFMRRVVLLPIFILQVILATLFAAIFFISALGGADFCITPNAHAIQLTSKIAAGDESLSPLFAMLIFYLSVRLQIILLCISITQSILTHLTINLGLYTC